MAGGHCMGFSVVAGLLQRGLGVPPASFAFGSATAFGLSKTPALEREIAYGFMFQALPSVVSQLVRFDARGLILRLQTALANRRNAYTLGVFKRDLTGGLIPGAEIHAMLLGGEQQWLQSAVPSFDLRFGGRYTVTLTGSRLRRPARESVALVGDSRLAAVANMAARPGKRESFTVSPGMRALTYTSQGSAVGTRLQLSYDAKAFSDRFQLTTKAIPAPGATVSFKYNPGRRQLTISVGKLKGTVRLALKVILSRSGKQLVKANRTLVVRGGQTTQISYG